MVGRELDRVVDRRVRHDTRLLVLEFEERRGDSGDRFKHFETKRDARIVLREHVRPARGLRFIPPIDLHALQIGREFHELV